MAKPKPQPVPIGATYVMMGQIAECQKHLTDDRVDPCNCQLGENRSHPTFIDNIPGKFLGPVSGKPIAIIRPDGTAEEKRFDPPPAILVQHSGKDPNVTQALPIVRDVPVSGKAARLAELKKTLHANHRRHHRPAPVIAPPKSEHSEAWWIGWILAGILAVILWSMWSAQSNVERNLEIGRAINAGRK